MMEVVVTTGAITDMQSASQIVTINKPIPMSSPFLSPNQQSNSVRELKGNHHQAFILLFLVVNDHNGILSSPDRKYR